MMAIDIEAIANERARHPDESRDELVARYTEAALYSLYTTRQKISADKLIHIAGNLVGYVEAHSGLVPAQTRHQFEADCTADRLPW
ncbi:MAG TPA: hypothetical protein VGR91_03275 [Stellaceae bacterium]|nr:hypothetical protein [Stellaceae bacterium]